MGNKKAKVVGVRLDDVGQYWLEHLAFSLGLSEAEVMRQALQTFAAENNLPTDRKLIMDRVRSSGQLSDEDDYPEKQKSKKGGD